MILIFQNDAKDESDKFEQWLLNNEHAFFINRKSADDYMLHRASCGHMKFEAQVKLTEKRKICSHDKRELEQWALEQSLPSLKVCRDCKP